VRRVKALADLYVLKTGHNREIPSKISLLKDLVGRLWRPQSKLSKSRVIRCYQTANLSVNYVS
jgi:hypothetical protein